MATFETVNDYTWVQTFFADPEIVNNSGEVSITSVELYFKNKPDAINNTSGKPKPGVAVRICEVVNNEPDLSKVYAGYRSFVEYDSIYAFSDSSSATTFGFDRPLKLQTGRFYGIVVTQEDPGFELWINKAGDRLLGTQSASSGSNLVRDGQLFNFTNANQARPLSDSDLKFRINVAQYVANTFSDLYVNDDYEFFTCNTISGRFLGGEWVYQTVANATGNVAFTSNTNIITGTGTTFDSEVVGGDRIVLFANSTYKQFVEVLNVVNATYMTTASKIVTSNTETNYMVPPSGRVHWFRRGRRKLYLTGSNANTTLKFQANANPIEAADSGQTALIESIDRKSVDSVAIKGSVNIPAAGSINATFTFTEFDGTNYFLSTTNSDTYNLADTTASQQVRLRNYDGYILSRSEEVDNANLFSNADLVVTNKSLIVNTELAVSGSNTNLFESPEIQAGRLDVYTGENLISNTYTTTDANGVIIDTEIATEGDALCKYYGLRVPFANNRFAEDIRVFMLGYRPTGTEIKVYARVKNSQDPEAFDDKAWTPLEYKSGRGDYSSTTDSNDLIEYELGFSRFSESANVIPGTFTTQLGNNIITAQGSDPTTYVAALDVVKVYNPLVPEDYIVGYVAAANSTTITLGDNIANNNVVGSGFKVDRLKYYNIAFNNSTNDNVARYFSSSLVEYDKFDTMQIKIVLLADTTYLVPEVDQISVIGVSA